MAPRKRPFTYCDGAPSWNPTTYAADAALHARAEALLADDDFASAIAASFSLPPPDRDKYTYHAIVSVTLAQAQHVVSLGRQNGLHAWYFAPSSAPSPCPPPNDNANATNTNTSTDPPPTPQKKTLTSLPPPPRADTEAYLSLFSASTSTASALQTFVSNAKKGSLRQSIATYLRSKRYLHPSLLPQLSIPKLSGKKKKGSPTAPANPYLQYLSWSIRALEWAGPCEASARAGLRSHHVLPVLMHHFGCACPSHEALSILRVLAAGRDVLDVGSGGGYWTFMLRAYGVRCTAVDNAQSAWRVRWVDDTVVAEGAAFLKKRRARKLKETGNAAETATTAVDPDEPVLLLVYPIVGGSVAGGSEGGFTRAMLDSYSGDTLAVVGTQNRNGYTGFRGESMDEYMEREQTGNGWVKVVQIALPSFPGKDEALFVFQRGARAPSQDVSSKEVSGKSKGESSNDSKEAT